MNYEGLRGQYLQTAIRTERENLAVTPSGDFQGSVGVSCTGAPRGATCSLSSQNVTLNGTDQEQITVSLNTNGASAAAGVLAGNPRSVGLRWLLMTIVALFTMRMLRRSRLRSSLLACALGFLLCWGATGCGSGSSSSGGGATPPGTYQLTLQGTSGSIVQKMVVNLVVE